MTVKAVRSGLEAAAVDGWHNRAMTRQDFTPFTAADLRQVRDTALEERVDVGTRLYAAGDRVDRVMVIGAGEVELSARTATGRRVLEVVRKGGVIADIPLFLDAPMPFDAVVSRRATVCELDRQALVSFLSSAPAASLRWMRSIALRLDDDRRRLLAILSSDLTAQVAFLLLEHAEPGPTGEPEVHLTHEVMAQLLGARRQSVSRVVAALRQQGLLTTQYRHIVLHDVDGLQDVAGPSLPAWTATQTGTR